LLLAGAAGARAQSFGRFGGEGIPQPVGFTISEQGFRVADAPGDTFQFLSPLADIKRVSRSDRNSEVSFRPAEGAPDGLRINLRSPGFEIHVKGKIVFKLGSLQRPLLTVEGATYDGAPSPVTKWMLLSFREPQPPVLFSVPEGEGLDWEIGGAGGEWTLTNRTEYDGWIRVCAPAGRTILKREDERDGLAELALALSQQAPLWSEPTTKLVSSSISEGDGFLQAIWTFDRPSAIIPPALLLCRTGGSGVEIVSGLTAAAADLGEGPQGFSAEPRWVFRFPIVKLPPGRALVRGVLPKEAPMEKQMLALFTSAGDPVWGKAQALGDGTETLVKSGRSAFAEIAMQRWGWKPTREGAGSIQKLLWSRDFSSLTLFGGTPAECAEASGWLALGLTAHDNPAMRLEGCLLWAGLTSQRTLAEYRRKRGLPTIELKKDVAVPDVLAAAYGQKSDVPSARWLMLNSPVRIISGQRVILTGDVVEWNPVPGEGPLRIIAPLDAGWTGVDGTQVTTEFWGTEWILRAKPGPSGKCRLKAKLPVLPDLR
jgi:hypothetical protein